MSHIPNSAMPHAGTINDNTTSESSESSDSLMFRGAGQIAEKIREYPKTAMAAGAVLAAGAIAAAAMPMMRSRDGEEGSSGSNGKSSGNSKSKSK